MNQTIEKAFEQMNEWLLEEEPPADEKHVHMRLVAHVTDHYLCGLAVTPGEPHHGVWTPASVGDRCPHCGQAICPECYDLAMVFTQLV